jgi:predicted RNase H-like HicB family nuclease
MTGYVVVFEGDDESGYSAYSPDLPGVVAAGQTRSETERLMVEAMAAHISMLREAGQPVPEPADAVDVSNPGSRGRLGLHSVRAGLRSGQMTPVTRRGRGAAPGWGRP